jgi:SpoVK/Ycf46/Vps4 family AAA+-type ATPase
MSSQEYMPAGGDVIRGIHTDIVLDNSEAELEHHLNTEHTPQTLYEMKPEGLRYPIEHAELGFHKNDPDDMSLHATVEFNSLPIRHQGIRSWKNLISKELRSRLQSGGYEEYRLVHQTHDFYVRLDDVHAIHIQFGTTTDECYIETSLVNLSQLSHASDDKLRFDPDPDEAQTPQHIDTLRRFATVWSQVIDAVTDTLGSPEHEHVERSQIVIAGRSRTSTSESPKISKELVPTKPLEPLEPPESETSLKPQGLDMVGGLTHAKERLRDIGNLFKDPVGSHMYGLSATHFLLYGPPGTGKTTLINALANEIGAEVFPIDSTSIVETWVGNSGKNVKALFNSLKEQPADQLIVVLMDEFDALGLAGNDVTRERKDVVKQLNIAIDDISKNHKNIIIAAATNADINDLEPALVRAGRIEPIGAPAPTEEERVDVWAAVLAESFLSFTERPNLNSASLDDTPSFIPYGDDIDPLELSRLTDGMTGADFKGILERARKVQFRKYQQTGEYGRVTQADLIHEIRTFGR